MGGRGIFGGDSDFICTYYQIPAAIINDKCSVCATPIGKSGEHGGGGEMSPPSPKQHTPLTPEQLKQLEYDVAQLMEQLSVVVDKASFDVLPKDVGMEAYRLRSLIRGTTDWKQRQAADRAQAFLESVQDG